MIEIQSSTKFLPLVDRLGVVRAKFKVRLESGVRLAYFLITGPLYSALLTSSTPEQILKNAEETLTESIRERKDIEGVYYFEHTGSHFHQLDEKPDWANDQVRPSQEVCKCEHARELHSQLFSRLENGKGIEHGQIDGPCRATACPCHSYSPSKLVTS